MSDNDLPRAAELIVGTLQTETDGPRAVLIPNPDLDPPETKALKLILDVLRANRLHQEACSRRQAVEENSRGMWHVEVPPCNCWLAGD